MMTYRELLEALLVLDDDELDLNVTVHDQANDEYYPIAYTDRHVGVDTLDDDHPILVMNATDMMNEFESLETLDNNGEQNER